MKQTCLVAAARKVLLVMLCLASLTGCNTNSIQPDLSRLYARTTPSELGTLSNEYPVVLVHGAFGARLCDAEGREHWPGSIKDLLLSSFEDIALPILDGEKKSAAQLTPCGMTDEVAGRDFYGRIEATLMGPGGYLLTRPGTKPASGSRTYYRFVYDWRKDNVQSARELDALVDQIREDHADPTLKVDIVAHSMGGLITRYWLRYGTVDVLNDNDFPVNNRGGDKARKVILVGTPSLGSTSALQQLINGAHLGVTRIPAEVLLSFPSGYQLLPHPIVEPILGTSGKRLNRDIFDIRIWRAFEWGPFDPGVRERLSRDGWQEDDFERLIAYTHHHLERARRFVWSLTVENPAPNPELIVFGGDCIPTPAKILIEDIAGESYVRLWPREVAEPRAEIDYEALMLEPGDGAVTKSSLLARAVLDPSVPRHRFSHFALDYPIMFCEAHSRLPGNVTFQDNLLHILLSR
ncbi:MAG: hypothetical protein Cons2KO_05060 [Congregibacter sp.]